MSVAVGVVALLCAVGAHESALQINDRYLNAHEELGFRKYSGDVKQSFQTDECRNFYGVQSTPAGGWLALEDLHLGGRSAALTQGVLHQEVIASLKWKFAYVVVRKSASTAISNALKVLFDADWFWCRQRCANVSACFNPQVAVGRCTTLALAQHELSSFFFFSFVRHPVERWFSQYAQAHVSWKLTHTVPSLERCVQMLLQMANESVVVEHHLQTQMHSLTSRSWRGTPVPLHFIGRAESVDRDWPYVVREIWRRNGAADYATRPIETLAQFNHHEQSRDAFVAHLNRFRDSTLLRDAIRRAYTQDLVCFGY